MGVLGVRHLAGLAGQCGIQAKVRSENNRKSMAWVVFVRMGAVAVYSGGRGGAKCVRDACASVRVMMMDAGRAALDGETPVNPYSLKDAVNAASDTVNTGWLIFLGVLSYLLITAAGVTHKDLLAYNDIPLPILQVKIDLARYFFFAPIILVLFHTGLVSQLVLLARKTLEFDSAIRLLEVSEQRTHPLRLELDSFFFVQAIAGPERSKVMSAFLHGMSWLTIVLLPVMILLYMQVVFLPYHDVAITTANRVALFADIAMLATIGTFLARSERTFFSAFRRTVTKHIMTTVVTTILLVGVMLFSLFAATIPGERLDRMTDMVRGRTGIGRAAATESGVLGFSIPFLKPSADGSLFGLFYRNIVVTDADLVPDNQVTAGEPSLNLRGRDLRFARLDRSDLHQADLTGADLEGASLVGADLRNITMGCVDIERLLLSDNREEAKCAVARNADFSRARMSEARMSGADLRGTRFDNARLTGAEFAHARLAGTSFTGAHLERADLTGGVSLYGTSFLTASLQGADLTGARLMRADFTSASLQGATLAFARLDGAMLRDADLEGADLQQARLYLADLSRAKVASADLRGAMIWRTVAPSPDPQGLADLQALSVRAPSQDDVERLKDLLKRIDDPRLKAGMEEGLQAVIGGGETTPPWASSPDAQSWSALQSASSSGADGYKAKLTEGLQRLACRTLNGSGAVAVGVGRRAMSPRFRGDLAQLYNGLKAADCPASRTVPAKFLADLSSAADVARGQ